MKKNKEDSPKTKSQRYDAFIEKHLCSYHTAGHRCQILGAISNNITGETKERWCGWHWLGLSHPESLQNFNEFQEFRENDRKTYPPGWDHASLYIEDEIAWQATLGKITHKEYIRYIRDKENEFDAEKFKNKVKSENPIREVAKSFEDDLPF